MSFKITIDSKTHEISTMQDGEAKFQEGAWMILKRGKWNIASAGEASRLNRLASALQLYTPSHTHGAVYENGKLTDKCRYCNHDLRSSVHQ